MRKPYEGGWAPGQTDMWLITIFSCKSPKDQIVGPFQMAELHSLYMVITT